MSLVGQSSSALLAALVLLAAGASGQCPVNSMTSFERISGVTVKGSVLSLLYTAPNVSLPLGSYGASGELGRQASSMSIPITAECNNRCRRSAKCRAFLVDYARHTCYSVDSPAGLASQGGLFRSPAPIQLEPSQERTSYFEKVCLSLPFVECERAWVFERVLAHQLSGNDEKVIEEVPSRLKCQELCLNEQEFQCRSGEYDYLTMQCKLSITDRHLKPKSFQPARSNVDYFENQCVPVGSQCDAFDRFEDMDLGRAEIMRPANTSDQCQQLCTQTIKAFICRSFSWNPATGKCYLNSMNSNMAGGLDKLQRAPGLTYYQRNDCFDLKLECDTTAMTLNLRTNEPFRGRMYVRDEPNACETVGRSSSLVSSLSIPFQSAHSRCATRELPSRYSSVVVVQQHPLIQRKSDRYIKLVCDFQTSNKTITSNYNVIANAWTSTALINATSLAPKIKLRITDKYGLDITGAKLGDELFLRIEAESDSVYDMVARSVFAKSGLTEESIMLIDKDGCPTDFRIFPALKKLNRKTIVGKFDAFKFSSDVVVRFQVDVQFCLNQCPASSCEQNLLLTNAQQPAGQLDQYSAGSLAGSLGSQGANGANSPSSPGSANEGTLELAGSTQTPPPYLARTTPAGPELEHAAGSNHKRNYYNHQAANEPALAEPPYQQQAAAGRQPPANLPGYLSTQLNSSMMGSLAGSAAGESQVFEHSRSAQADSSKEAQQAPEAKANSLNSLAEAHRSSDGLEHASQLAESHNHLPSSSISQPQQQQRRRRRRSAEPIPETPSHVPLQREIIVESSPSGASSPRMNQSSGRRRNKSSELPGEFELEQKPRQQQREGRIADEKAAAATRNPAGRETNEGNKVELEQQHLERTDEWTTSGRSSPLVCTTRYSLVLASLAFCFVQFLTIAVCLLTWMHKRDAIKFKVGLPSEQRFH